MLFSRVAEVCCDCELKKQLIKYRKGKLPRGVAVYNGKLRFTGKKPVDEVDLTIDNIDEIARFFVLYIDEPERSSTNEAEPKKPRKISGNAKYYGFPRNLRIYLMRTEPPENRRFMKLVLTHKFYTDKKFRSNVKYGEIGQIRGFPEFDIEEPETKGRVFTLGEILLAS